MELLVAPRPIEDRNTRSELKNPRNGQPSHLSRTLQSTQTQIYLIYLVDRKSHITYLRNEGVCNLCGSYTSPIPDFNRQIAHFKSYQR